MKKTILLALCLLAGPLLAAQPQTTIPVAPLPSGSNLLQRLMDRFATQARATNTPAWTYDKRQTTEKLDSDAKVKESTTKLYHMRFTQGVPVSQLFKIEGRDLSPAELKKEEQHDMAFEKEISGRDPKKAVKQRESLVTKDLLDRFDFKTLRREPVQGHLTVVITFEGKPRKDEGSIPDRLISRMAGTLWIDETTTDIARMEIHLTKDLSIGIMGVLGAIKDCKMDIIFKPMTDGSWLPETSHIALSYRVFLSTTRIQIEETSTNYKLEPPAK
jgi:hypothetical protein